MANQIMPLAEAAQIVEDESRLLTLLKTPNPTVPMILAARRDIGEDIMRQLAKRPRPVVRRRLMQVNADRLPVDVLESLMNDTDGDICVAAKAEFRRRSKLQQGETR